MSLKDLQQAAATEAAPDFVNTTFGAVLRVATAQEVDGGLKLTGTTLTGNSRLDAGSEVSVVFTDLKGKPRDGGRSLSNFVKGHDKKVLQQLENAAGSYVTLESCYLTKNVDENGRKEISSRWINTLAAVGDTDHANRSFVENVYATAQRLAFDNPSPQPGEPKRITLPVNAKTIRARVVVDGQAVDREFPREWAVEKLKALPAKSKVAVTIDTIDPQEAMQIHNQGELDTALRDQLGRGTKALSMIRVSDGEDVMARLIYVPFKRDDAGTYSPDVDKAMEELYARNIIKGIPNAALFKAINAGELTAEVVPGYRMTYAGDTTQDNNAAFKLVSDVKQDRALSRSEVIFGSDANRFAKVILSGIARNNTVDGFSPTLVITDEPGNYAATEIRSAHIGPRAPAAGNDDGTEDSADDEPAGPRP